MVFNSVQFAAFFVAVMVLYWASTHRVRTALLLVASYFFYGCWDYRFLSLIIISTIIDFISARQIVRASTQRRRGAWLALSAATNLSLLGVFKYFDFFADNLQALLTALGYTGSLATLNVILPVGISFYTFQTMSYTIDVYRGRIQPTKDFLQFAVFVAFFPQLVAGPIERAASLLPQVARVKRFDTTRFISALELMAWGFFKKMFVADNLASIANTVFDTPVADQTGLQLLLGVYAFALQIYCDFSGYSDIARGAARCLGFELMINFRYPYLSTNPREFWQRWHISLSSWLRDYLYIPLGGNRKGNLGTFRNLSITMLLGGLWHGAAWTFVFWGAYQGLLLIVHRLAEPILTRAGRPLAGLRPISWFLRVIVFFHLVCIGWVFFRAQSLRQAFDIIGAMGTDLQLGAAGGFYLKSLLFYGFVLMIADTFAYFRERQDDQPIEMPRLRSTLGRAALSLFAVSSVLLFGAFDEQQFIYFQF